MIVGHSLFTPIHIQVNQQRKKDIFHVDLITKSILCFSTKLCVNLVIKPELLTNPSFLHSTKWSDSVNSTLTVWRIILLHSTPPVGYYFGTILPFIISSHTQTHLEPLYVAWQRSYTPMNQSDTADSFQTHYKWREIRKHHYKSNRWSVYPIHVYRTVYVYINNTASICV